MPTNAATPLKAPSPPAASKPVPSAGPLWLKPSCNPAVIAAPITLRDLNTRISNALQTLTSKPAPADGASLMKLYAQQHFANCPAGGMGLKRHLGDVSAFLI